METIDHSSENKAGENPSKKKETSSSAQKPKKKYLKYYIVLGLIAASVGWYFYKTHSLQKEGELQLMKQAEIFERRFDSLSISQAELTSKTLSWAVRGEMLRGNKEQIRQYFNEFVKNKGILRVQLLRAEDGYVEISTNSKDEGLFKKSFTKINEQQVIEDTANFRIVTPITSLNNNMNILLVDVQKANK